MDLHDCVTMEEMLSEALLNNVSPVFKQEILKHGSHYRTKESTASHLGHMTNLLAQQHNPGNHIMGSMSQACAVPPVLYHNSPRPHQHALPVSHRQETPHLGINSDWVNLMTSGNLPHLDETESRFQYILGAATSPAVKVDEEPLTYLNQGQSYELKLKRLSNHNNEQFLKSRVRVIFHERRLQYMEKEQMEHWKAVRPGERILDLEVPMSYGLIDLKVDHHNLNCFEFTWDTDMEAAVYIKINCISTEFTAKKHGGEKGVPFRVQVETYSPGVNSREQLIHCASCQVKVFKPKGADRKHKTDREKIEKMADVDRDKYQPSFDYTTLTEIPLEQVLQYLDQLRKQQEGNSMTPAGPCIKEEQRLSVPNVSSCLYRADCGQPLADSSSRSSENDCRSPQSNTLTPGINRQFFKDTMCSPAVTECASLLTLDSLSIQATSQQVSQWLRSNRFSNFVQTFQSFSGADIMRLSREDLIQLCGPADGIRLNNALHVKRVRPCLTLHVVLEPLKTYSHNDPYSGLSGGNVNISTSSTSGCWSPTSSNSPSSILSSFQSTGNPDPDQQSPSPLSPPPHCTSSVSDIGRYQRFLSSRKRPCPPDTGLENDRSSAKKHCVKTDEQCCDQVFHAVHLESLTKDHLLSRLADLFDLQAKQILELCLQTSSGIVIYISDSVVQNLPDLSRFVAGAKEDDTHSGLFQVLLKTLECS